MSRRSIGASLAGILCLIPLAAAPSQASYFADGPEREPVRAASPGASKPLPGSLIVRPGRYTLHGHAYDMRREGYYRLGRRQRIVYRRSVAALMSGLSWSSTSSGKDDGAPEKVIPLMPQRRVGLTCGPMIEVIKRLVDEQGIRARSVGTLAKELDQRQPDGQEPGLDHVLIELELHGRWQLWDPFNHGRPLVDGRPTTVVGWTTPRGERRLKPIARPDDNRVPERLTAFYLRFTYTPLVARPGYTFPYYFTDPPTGPDPEQRRRVTEYRSGLEYLPREDFMKWFYPGQAVDY